MLEERDEFLLSRYPDNDLSQDELAHIEKLLAESPEARALLRQYRQLSGLLHLGRVSPALDHDELRAQILANIDTPSQRELTKREQAERDRELAERDLTGQTSLRERRALRSSTTDPAYWQSPSRTTYLRYNRSLALAAGLLIALGISWQVFNLATSPTTPQNPTSPNAIATLSPPTSIPPALLSITGPTAQPPSGTAAASISIGPSLLAAKSPAESFYSNELRKGPTRVTIDPEVLPATKPDDRFPF